MTVYLCTGHIVNEEIESLIVQKTYMYRSNHFNSLPNKNIVDQSKIRAFADIIIEGKKEMKFDLGRVENIVEKGKNAGNRYFLLNPQGFQNPTSLGIFLVKADVSLPLCWEIHHHF